MGQGPKIGRSGLDGFGSNTAALLVHGYDAMLNSAEAVVVGRALAQLSTFLPSQFTTNASGLNHDRYTQDSLDHRVGRPRNIYLKPSAPTDTAQQLLVRNRAQPC